MKDEKYTLAESAAVFALTAFGIVVAAILVFPVVFPVVILTAWMRETAWNWYCASFHLPYVSLWEMVVVGVFVGMFSSSTPTLKDDLLKFKSWQNSLFAVLGQVIAFGIIAVIHIWFKG